MVTEQKDRMLVSVAMPRKFSIDGVTLEGDRLTLTFLCSARG